LVIGVGRRDDHSIGRVAVWLVEPALVVRILTFPSGRFTSAWDRRLAIAMPRVVGTVPTR
jgi:hypothetical protein